MNCEHTADDVCRCHCHGAPIGMIKHVQACGFPCPSCHQDIKREAFIKWVEGKSDEQT